MNFYEGIDESKLRIKQFIFHVVHHGEDEPILLDETPIDGHEAFFMERVEETLKGKRFIFNDLSKTQSLLEDILNDPSSFVAASKDLAIYIHSANKKSIKPGVLMLIKLSDGNETLFSLIKYDHDQMIRYSLVDGNTKALLEEVTNGFTKAKKALHKAAVIRKSPAGWNLVVYDSKVSYDISEFFKDFLGVRRKYSKTEMTEAIEQVALDTVKKHRRLLPKEVTGKIRHLVHEVVSNNETFEADSFFDKIFGAYGNNVIKKTFVRALEKRDLDGESFKFDKNAIKKPRNKKLETIEGVKINYDVKKAGDTVKILQPDGKSEETIIEITTKQLFDL